MRGERGFTLTELLVGMGSFVVLFGAIVSMTTVALHNQDRISKRVWANQRARPVMTRIADGLRSGCVAPRAAPVQAGSSGTEIRFISETGSAVSPVPDLRVISLSGTQLTETVYAATGGSAPSWTFSTTPTSTRMMMTQVAAPSGGIFRYYDYVGGRLSANPLPTPLSATNAARTAYVNISFTTAPSGGASSQDLKSPITLSDAVDLRLETAGQLTTQDNLPCT